MTVYTELFDTAAADALLLGTNMSPSDNTIFGFTIPSSGTVATRASKKTINGLAGHGSALIPGSAGTATYLGWNTLSFTKFKARFYCYMTTGVATDTFIFFVGTGATRKGSLHVNSASKLRLSDSTGTTGVTGGTDPNVYPLSSLHYIDVYGDLGTGGAGTLKFQLSRASDDAIIFASSGAAGAQNLGTATFDTFYVGKTNASSYATDFYLSGFTLDTAPTDTAFLGKYIAAGASSSAPSSIASSTGWTLSPSGGAVVTALSDSDDVTGIVSSDNPTNLLVDMAFGALTKPTGDCVVQVRGQKLNATTGKYGAAKLYAADGTTLLATAADVTIPDSLTTANITFLAASLTASTQAQWSAGVRLKLFATAT